MLELARQRVPRECTYLIRFLLAQTGSLIEAVRITASGFSEAGGSPGRGD